MKTAILSVIVATGLSACTSVESLRPDVDARTPPSRLEEIAYINTLREAFAPGVVAPCYRGDPTYFRADLSQGYPDHTPAQEGVESSPAAAPRCVTYRDLPGDPAIRRYLEAGYGLSDLYCQRFFTVASQSALRRRFQRNVGTAVDSLVGTVLSLATAGETAIGIVNAGFGAIDSTFQNMDDSFLVAPDLENVRALVQAAQDAYRLETLPAAKLPKSYPAARASIERYAGICSFTGMRRLVNVSLAAQQQQVQGGTDRSQQRQGQGQQPEQAQQQQSPPVSQPTRPAASIPAPPVPPAN